MKSLEEYLIRENYLTKNDLEKVKGIQLKTDKRLDEVLVEEGFMTESEMTEILATAAGVPSVNLNKLYISPDVIQLVPEYLARKHLALPIKKNFERDSIGANWTVVDDEPGSRWMIQGGTLYQGSNVFRSENEFNYMQEQTSLQENPVGLTTPSL